MEPGQAGPHGGRGQAHEVSSGDEGKPFNLKALCGWHQFLVQGGMSRFWSLDVLLLELLLLRGVVAEAA